MGFRRGALEDLVMLSGFWSGKSVLITGHTGFKGSWLALLLWRLGARVTGYSLPPPTRPSLYEIAQVSKGITSITGDVRDLESVSACVAQSHPEIVIHMAAQSLVRRSYAEPLTTFDTNVMGTVHVLEALRRHERVRALVVITSDKCYENREVAGGYREHEPLGGYDPYSASKACVELVCAAYRRSFFASGESGQSTAVASARAGNVIGGGDWAADRLVPDVMAAFSAGQPARLRYPRAVRPWQHVLEPLRGYLDLAQRLYQPGQEFAEAWNFGPADSDVCSVADVANRLAAAWGGGASWRTDGNNHPYESFSLRLHCGKAQERLGWSPAINLDGALAWTVDWYRAYFAGEQDMRALTLAQIDSYLGRLAS